MKSRYSVNKDTFCIGPWVEIRINSDGSLNYCHAADNADLSDQDSIMVQDLDTYFNSSQTMLQVRQSLITGHSVARCHRCYAEESAGCISFRQRRNIQAAIFPGDDFDQSLRESGFLSRDHLHPRFYHVSFSNLCNMSCMMCKGHNSTKLETFLRKSGIIQSRLPISRDWTTGSAWTSFCQHLLNNPEIVCLHIMGGEPMYHKRFRELLEFLCDNNHTDFHFTFVTNGTIYDRSIIDLLKNFRSVQIEISIEGIGLENDYVRHTSDTVKILENIDNFLTQRSDIIDVVLRTVPQALTVHNYWRVLEFCREKQIVIDSNPLFGMEFLHSNVLPDDIKTEVRQSLGPFLHKHINLTDGLNARNRDRIDAVLSNNANFVLAHLDRPVKEISDLRHRFAEYCSKWDKARGYHLADFVPRLVDFATKYGYDPD